MTVLRLVLGDQLDPQHSWFSHAESDCVYAMMEMRQETDYVRHHVQKVVGFFAAMRRFAAARTESGHRVHYLTLDDRDNRQSLEENLEWLIDRYDVRRLEYQLPDEYRLDRQLSALADSLDIEVVATDSEHFLTGRGHLAEFFADRKTYLMESFYRHIRKTHDILMEAGEPVGGRWNFDRENRNRLPAKVIPPEPMQFDHDLGDILNLLEDAGVETLGRIDAGHFPWPLDREESLVLLEWFVSHCLPCFGTYQDAMTPDHWAIYHSRLSFSLNTKMLRPREVIDSAIAGWRARPDAISLPQVEGFVRQIVGWREYMRGVYWAHMPEYASLNHFGHRRSLPGFFWDGKTRMACMKHSIEQSLEHAYAHHIQRLMVTGNFALLAGIDPDEVDAWYLGIYIDAIQWVEVPNTRGMSQFADGGIVGTKPYAASANYINKMSHYCKGCHYDPRDRLGDRACPFNSLYWQFLHRHRKKLSANHRMAMVFRSWDRMKASDREAILRKAKATLDSLDSL